MKTIKLTNGRYTIIDDSDFEYVSKYIWYMAGEYVARYKTYRIVDGKRKMEHLYLHRELLGCSEEMLVDHINRDTLDNQRSNLRLCTSSQNNTNRGVMKNNTSGYRGVSLKVQEGRVPKWVAAIRINKKLKTLGHFINKKDAALAYNQKAKELFGSFAVLNAL